MLEPCLHLVAEVPYVVHIACEYDYTLMMSAPHRHVSDMLSLAARADATIAPS